MRVELDRAPERGFRFCGAPPGKMHLAESFMRRRVGRVVLQNPLKFILGFFPETLLRIQEPKFVPNTRLAGIHAKRPAVLSEGQRQISLTDVLVAESLIVCFRQAGRHLPGGYIGGVGGLPPLVRLLRDRLVSGQRHRRPCGTADEKEACKSRR